MATKKAAAPSAKVTEKKPVSAEPEMSVEKWDAEMARIAGATVAMEQNALGGGNFIGTQGGILTYKKAPIPDNTLDCVIVGHILENTFYKEKFDSDTPATPICFAFGLEESEMAPHEASEEPQSPTCAECPHNEWGSADTGKGKACRNSRRIALITEDDALEDALSADVAYLRPPVTSVKGFAGLVTSIAKTLNVPPFGVVTNVSTAPDKKTQFKILFKIKEKLSTLQMKPIYQKHLRVMKEIDFPYIRPAAAPEPTKTAGKFNKGKKAVTKRK